MCCRHPRDPAYRTAYRFSKAAGSPCATTPLSGGGRSRSPAEFLGRCRAPEGDTDGLESAIRFPEVDPYFDRLGYVKADLLRIMNGLPLDPEQTVRLRASSCPQCLHHSPTMTRSTMSSACIISAAVTTSGGVNVSTLPMVVLNESP